MREIFSEQTKRFDEKPLASGLLDDENTDFDRTETEVDGSRPTRTAGEHAGAAERLLLAAGEAQDQLDPFDNNLASQVALLDLVVARAHAHATLAGVLLAGGKTT